MSQAMDDTIRRAPAPASTLAPELPPDPKSHWGLLASISDLGWIRINLADSTAALDARAARHHRLPQPTSSILTTDAWLSRFAEADKLRVQTLVQGELKAGRTVCAIVRLRWSTEGEPPTLELSFRAEPETGNVMGVCRDVTTAHGLGEVRRHRIAGERTSRAKSEFMSQVSHELRTPLNSILGFAQLMAMDVEQPLSSKQRERLQMLQHSSLRLLGLVDQLLQIGRIEQGKLNLRSRSVRVLPLVRRCVDALAPMAQEHTVTVHIDVGIHAAAVRADPDALEQVLINLLSNGIKYNRRGGQLTVRYEAADEGQLIVDDTGRGLTVSQMARLFEPFNRLDAAHSGIQGAGLGLVISRKLVEEMRGSLQVWSEVGVGSRFRVTLPRARNVRSGDCETLPLDMPCQWSTGDQFRILYIEDDDVNVVLVDQLFATQPEWQLSVAMTGAAGLAEAIRIQPDFILLDLGLPDITGWEVHKRLKLDRRTSDIPVIALSADAMPANQRRGRASGFTDYWTKPLDLPTTIDKLKALCNMVRRR